MWFGTKNHRGSCPITLFTQPSCFHSHVHVYSWSSRLIDWMIMLFERWTLNFTFAREYECPRLSWALAAASSALLYTHQRGLHNSPFSLPRPTHSSSVELHPSLVQANKARGILGYLLILHVQVKGCLPSLIACQVFPHLPAKNV